MAQAQTPDNANTVTQDDVIRVALEAFSQRSYSDAKLERIAQQSGMSKRMIHYYFGDKKGLYQQVLQEALERLHPTEAELQVDTAIPVEGVRHIVEAIYNRYVHHPEAVALIQREATDHVLDLESIPAVFDQSRIILPLDKLLMLGQDAGAFRPGISAYDIYYMVTSLCTSRVTSARLFDNIFGINQLDAENTDGLRRMVVDSVLTFLTANLPDSEYESYLSFSLHHPDETDNDVNSIYHDPEAAIGDFAASIYKD